MSSISILSHFAPSTVPKKRETPPSAPRKSPKDLESTDDDQQPGFMDGAPSNREDPAEEEFEFTFAGGAALKFEDGDDEGEQDGDVHMLSSQLSSGSRGVTQNYRS